MGIFQGCIRIIKVVMVVVSSELKDNTRVVPVKDVVSFMTLFHMRDNALTKKIPDFRMQKVLKVMSGSDGEYFDRQSDRKNDNSGITDNEYYYDTMKILSFIFQRIKTALMDLLPIILVIAFFQIVVIRQPLPQLGEVIFGALLVVAGLVLFVQGLEMGLFPIGEAMAYALARKGSLFWLLLFAFALGFSTTVAEPALIAVAAEAADIAGKGGLIDPDEKSLTTYALGLRISVAVSVGLAILVGVIRILKGWPIHYLIIGGYVVVMLMTIIAPAEIIGIAYDAGGVTTSTITVPLVAALGVGLASSIQGRSPLLDGFGLIAFASLLPMIFVMGYGLLIFN